MPPFQQILNVLFTSGDAHIMPDNLIDGGKLLLFIGQLQQCAAMALRQAVFTQGSQHRIAVAEKLAAGANASEVIIEIFEQLPLPEVTMVVLVVAMIFFYASTFDALAMVMSTYSYKGDDLREPGKGMKAYWSLIFVVLPIGLLFSEQAMTELQTISIIAALPISVCLLLVLISFFKSSKRNEV